MTTEVTGGAQTDDSGAGIGKTTDKRENITQEKKTVLFDDHKRALDDLHKYKSQARELEQRMNAVDAERLKEKEDYKSLSERYEGEATEWKQKFENQSTALVDNKKYDSVRSAAIKAGLMSEAEADLDMLDLSKLDHELTSKGRIVVHGADEYVEQLKKTRPHWFKTAKAPKINTGGNLRPDSNSGDLTIEQYVKMEKKLRRERRHDELNALNRRYMEQRKKRS